MGAHGTLAALLPAATIVLVFNSPVRAGEGASAAWTPPLYVFCVEAGVPEMKPRSLAEQVAMLHKLGFDGAAYPLWLGDQLDKNLETLDRAGVALYMVETAVDLGAPTDLGIPRCRGRSPGSRIGPSRSACRWSGSSPAIPRGWTGR